MDSATVQRFLDGMKYEAARTAPPEGFPQLTDIPAGRYVDPAFLALEREHLWKKSWLYVCHAEQIAAAGQFRGDAPDGLTDHHRARQGRCHPGVLQHLPASRRSVGQERYAAAAKGLSAAITAGPMHSTAGCSICATGGISSGSICRQRSLIPVRCERFFNWVFINEDPRRHAAGGAFPAVHRALRAIPAARLALRGAAGLRRATATSRC